MGLAWVDEIVIADFHRLYPQQYCNPTLGWSPIHQNFGMISNCCLSKYHRRAAPKESWPSIRCPEECSILSLESKAPEQECTRMPMPEAWRSRGPRSQDLGTHEKLPLQEKESQESWFLPRQKMKNEVDLFQVGWKGIVFVASGTACDPRFLQSSHIATDECSEDFVLHCTFFHWMILTIQNRLLLRTEYQIPWWVSVVRSEDKTGMILGFDPLILFSGKSFEVIIVAFLMNLLLL